MKNKKQGKIIDCFDGEYDFLSNFYLCNVNVFGLDCISSESAFQCMKTSDAEKRYEIAHSLPSRAKKLGREVSLRADWNGIKDTIMFEVVFSKFSQNKDLGLKLLDTKDAILIEGNTWGDKYWGVCDGEGENKLGQILMKVREILANREVKGE